MGQVHELLWLSAESDSTMEGGEGKVARMGQIISRATESGKRVHDKWVSVQYRWWYIGGATLLALIFDGPRQWLADRSADLNALLQLPDELWGKWLLLTLGFGLIGWGVYRSGVAASARIASENTAAVKTVAAILGQGAVPDRLAAVQVLGAELDRELSALQRVDGPLAEFEGIVGSIRDGNRVSMQQVASAVEQVRMGSEGLAAAAMLSGTEVALPDLNFPQPNPPASDSGYLASTRPFDPETNPRLVGLYSDALNQLREARDQIAQSLARRAEERRTLLVGTLEMATKRTV